MTSKWIHKIAILPLMFFAATLLVSAAPMLSRPVQGHIVEARASSQSTIYLWDATQYVIALRRDHLLGNEGLRAMEITALDSLASRAAAAHSTHVALRALYMKTGAVNPMYGTPTFAGVELVFVMTANREKVIQSGTTWKDALARGITPDGLKIEISGTLPPA